MWTLLVTRVESKISVYIPQAKLFKYTTHRSYDPGSNLVSSIRSL